MHRNYLIHKSGRGWYRPLSKGYTLLKEEAGFYTLEEAEAITRPKGPEGPRDGMTYMKSEDAAFTDAEVDLQFSAIKQERDFLRKENEKLSGELEKACAEVENLRAKLEGAHSAAGVIGRYFSALF